MLWEVFQDVKRERSGCKIGGGVRRMFFGEVGNRVNQKVRERDDIWFLGWKVVLQLDARCKRCLLLTTRSCY